MKKMYKYILIITLMMFSFVGEVRADSTTYCRYVAESNDDIIEIKKVIKGTNKLFNIAELYVYVNNKNKHIINKNYTIGATAYDSLGEECPAKVYWRKDGPSYCFDNDDGHCTTKFTYKDGEGNVGLKGDIENVFKTNGGSGISIKAGVNDCVTKGTCKPLCYYADENVSDYAIIYYFPNEDKFKSSFSWKDNNKVYELKIDSGTAFIGSSEKDDLRNAICPSYIYKDAEWYNEDEVCYDSDGNYCVKQLSTHFDENEKLNDITPKTLMTLEELQALIPVDNNLSCEIAVEEILTYDSSINKINQICTFRENGLISDVNQFFIANINNSYRFFKYSGTGGNFSMKEIPAEIQYKVGCEVYTKIYFVEQYNQYGMLMHSYYSNKMGYAMPSFDPGTTEPAPINTLFSQQCTLYPDGEKGISGDIDIKDCESLIGVELREELNSWLLYIKIAVPIIIIVMGSLDFGKAFIASDEDAMKKAQKKFIMRLIIGMVIFFIPALINILLNIATQVWVDISGGTCGITF